MTRRRGRAPAGTRLLPGRTTRAAVGGGGEGGGTRGAERAPTTAQARRGGARGGRGGPDPHPVRPHGAAWALPPSPEGGVNEHAAERRGLFRRGEESRRGGGRRNYPAGGMERATGRMGGGANPAACAPAARPLTLPCRQRGAASAPQPRPAAGPGSPRHLAAGGCPPRPRPRSGTRGGGLKRSSARPSGVGVSGCPTGAAP